MSNCNRTPERATAFCAALAETCNVGKACKAISIGRSTAYEWREADPLFAAAWDNAMRVGVSALEDEAHRRAFEGVADPLTHQGQFSYAFEAARDEIGEVIRDENGAPKMVPALDENGKPKLQTVQKYSDTLAIFLLKAHSPEKYRDNSKVELAGSLALHNMSEEEIRAELAALTAGGMLQASAPEDVSDLI